MMLVHLSDLHMTRKSGVQGVLFEQLVSTLRREREASGSTEATLVITGDIFASMERLRGNGVRFVPISANYYDDLRARLDLGEDLVRRMQALDILYDRSSSGEYFHAYGETFADRFFFEIVQRRDYDGYGAVNAPARMAAQEQHPNP